MAIQTRVGVPGPRPGVLHPGQRPADEARSLSLAASIRRHVYDLYSIWNHAWAWENNADKGTSWRESAIRAGEVGSSIREYACISAALGSAVENFSVDPWKPRAIETAKTLIGLLDAATGAETQRESHGDVLHSHVGIVGMLAAGRALAVCGRVTGELTLTERAADLVRELYQNARDPLSGGIVVETAGGASPQAFDLGIQLDALSACLSLVHASGAMEWRKRSLDLSLFVVARFFDPTHGSVMAKFYQTPEEEIERADPPLTLNTSSTLSEASSILEEPALSDIAGRLICSVIGVGGRRADCKPGQNAGGERRLEVITRSGLQESTAALHALAHHYARRPSDAILESLEAEWHTILNGLNDLVSRRPGSNLRMGSTILPTALDPVGCELCGAILCAAAMLTRRGSTS